MTTAEQHQKSGQPRPSGSSGRPGEPAAGSGTPGGSAPGPSGSGPSGSGDQLSAPAGPDGIVAGALARAHRHPVAVATALAAVLHVVWFFTFANSGGDLAAQDAWAEFVGRHPDTAYNLAWYGGMHPVSYSVVSPYVMHMIGVRTTMMIAGTCSAGLLALILTRCRGAVRRPLWPALAGVYGLLCNALSGRVTFGLGVLFALGAVAAVFCWPRKWARRRWAKAAVAAPLAALATAASPVAGLFLGVIAAALFLSGRRPGAYALGLAPVAVVGLSAWLFPFSGTQPMKIGSAWLPFVFALAIVFLVPERWKTVRIASAVYALGVFLTWAIDSQVGSNVTRLVMLFGGAVFLAALPYAAPRSRRRRALLLAFAGLTVWITTNSVTDIVRTTPVAAWNRELAPLIAQLQKAHADRGRVEVVPASSHRESSAFPSYVNLARGWNRQADLERNPLFYDDTLTAESYRAWLERWAVHYVVLPADKPDSGGKDEAKLLRGGLPYLREVWGDANWKLFEVQDPASLVGGPAKVVRAGADQMVIDVEKPGRVLVRIPHSPWLGLVDATGKPVLPPQETFASRARGASAVPKEYANTAGCLFKAAPDALGDVWTELLVPAPGQYRVSAKYQIPRGTPCPESLIQATLGTPERPAVPPRP
ncbi:MULTISPECIES: MFS transporter [unclassified Streptomyces]|uniref:MFS transporter n=1 Tax=unclassified Streptomyces TaxID=2593676 RepID=UPI0029BA7680|nr:MFS transporter [Streptomyces sp. DK15]MDX2391244.1 MFS transporter [Streptomyces sp. DK15]